MPHYLDTAGLTKVKEKMDALYETKEEASAELAKKANSEELGNYLPLTGGTLTGSITAKGSPALYVPIQNEAIRFFQNNPTNGTVGMLTGMEYTGTSAKATADADGNVISTTYAKTDSLATVATSGSYDDLTNKPTIPSAYTLPTATATTLGGVKVGSGLSVSTDGTISANAEEYALPTASATTLGGIKVGDNLSISIDGTLSASASVTVDSALSSTSTNPVQNKVINSALEGKLSTSGGTITGSITATNNPAMYVPVSNIAIGFYQNNPNRVVGTLTGINYTGTAAKAKADANGDIIADTYAKIEDIAENPVTDVTESGGTVTVTKYDGTESTFEAGDPNSIVSITDNTGSFTYKNKAGTSKTIFFDTALSLPITDSGTYYPILSASHSDVESRNYKSTKLTVQPSTGNLTCGTVNGVDVTALAAKVNALVDGDEVSY